MNKPLCISLTLALLSLTHASLHNEQPSETAQAASKSREASPRRRSASQPPATKQHAAATNANNNPPAQNSNDTQPLPPVTKRTSPEDTGCCGFGAKKKRNKSQ